MRWISNIPNPEGETVRLMVYQAKPDQVYVFGYYQLADGACNWDAYCTELEDAWELGEEFGIPRDAWEEIPDPVPGAQHDWIQEVKIRKD